MARRPPLVCRAPLQEAGWILVESTVDPGTGFFSGNGRATARSAG